MTDHTARGACGNCGRLLYGNPAICPDCGWTEPGVHRHAFTFWCIADEIARARKKFPSNRFLLAALTEEVGELAQALLQGRTQDARREAIQVACVAIRILEEGDSLFELLTEEEMQA